MKYISTYAGLAVVIGVTIVGSVIHGRLSGRGGTNEKMIKAAELVRQLPKQFGDWETREEQELNERAQELLDLAGYVSRTYANQLTGEQVDVIVMVGRSGPLSVHTPEVCYSSRDMEMLGKPERRVIVAGGEQKEEGAAEVAASESDGGDHFWKVAFQEKDLSADRIGVWYAWSDGGTWQAPNQPRFSLSGVPLLFKIQVRGFLPMQQGGDSAADDPCENFLRDFVPVVDDAVLSSFGNS